MVAARRRSAASGPLRGLQRHVRRRARSCVQSNLPAMPTIGEGGLIPPISGQSPFYSVMQHVQLSRQRNGAYGWSIARDIADPELWTERFHCPTWLDYLRQRNRSTQSERALHQQAIAFHLGPDPVRIRRMLERPVGSRRLGDDKNTPP